MLLKGPASKDDIIHIGSRKGQVCKDAIHFALRIGWRIPEACNSTVERVLAQVGDYCQAVSRLRMDTPLVEIGGGINSGDIAASPDQGQDLGLQGHGIDVRGDKLVEASDINNHASFKDSMDQFLYNENRVAKGGELSRSEDSPLGF